MSTEASLADLARLIAADSDGAIRRAIVDLIGADVEAIATFCARRELDLRGIDAKGVDLDRR